MHTSDTEMEYMYINVRITNCTGTGMSNASCQYMYIQVQCKKQPWLSNDMLDYIIATLTLNSFNS